MQPSRSQSLKFAGTNSLKSALITVWTGVAAEWLLRRAAGDRGVHDGLRLVSERRAPMSSPPINHADHPANGRMAGRTSVRARCTSVTPRVGYLPRARTQPRRRECMTFAPPLPFPNNCSRTSPQGKEELVQTTRPVALRGSSSLCGALITQPRLVYCYF